MKDYAKELMSVWTNGGEQEAFDRGSELLREIKGDIADAQREYAAIEAIMFVLRNRPGVSVLEELAEPDDGLDTILPELRRKYIIDAANAVCQRQAEAYTEESIAVADALGHWRPLHSDGPFRVTTQQVLWSIESQGLSLGVQQPHAVIGTVLANAEGFQRIARNTFETTYNASSETDSPTEPDGLPF